MIHTITPDPARMRFRVVAAFAATLLAIPAVAQQISYDPEILTSCVDMKGGFDAGKSGSGKDGRSCVGVAAARCMLTKGGDTTAGMSGCLAAEAAQWDKLLNQGYDRFLALLTKSDEELKAVGSAAPPTAPDLRAAQRAWIAWRDAECTMAVNQWQGGTGGGPAGQSCLMQLTGERALDLMAKSASMDGASAQ